MSFGSGQKRARQNANTSIPSMALYLLFYIIIGTCGQERARNVSFDHMQDDYVELSINTTQREQKLMTMCFSRSHLKGWSIIVIGLQYPLIVDRQSMIEA